MNSQYQVKTMLQEKAAMLQKHGNELSGEKFRNHTVERKTFTDSKKCLPGAAHIHRDGVRGKKFFSNYGKFNNGSKFRQQTKKVNKDMVEKNKNFSSRTFFNMNSFRKT